MGLDVKWALVFLMGCWVSALGGVAAVDTNTTAVEELVIGSFWPAVSYIPKAWANYGKIPFLRMIERNDIPGVRFRIVDAAPTGCVAKTGLSSTLAFLNAYQTDTVLLSGFGCAADTSMGGIPAGQAEIPLNTPTAKDPTFANPGLYPMVNQVMLSDYAEVDVMMDLAYNLMKLKRNWAILFSSNPTDALKEQKMQELAKTKYPIGYRIPSVQVAEDATDSSPAISAVSTLVGIKVFFVFGIRNPVARMFGALNHLGFLTADQGGVFVLVGNYALKTVQVSTLLGYPVLWNWTTGAFGLEVDINYTSPLWREAEADYKRFFNETPPAFPDQAAPWLDNALLGVAAIYQVAFANLSNAAANLRNGKLVQAAMRNVTVQGVTGTTQLNKSTGFRIGGRFKIMNNRGTSSLSWTQVGVSTEDGLTQLLSGSGAAPVYPAGSNQVTATAPVDWFVNHKDGDLVVASFLWQSIGMSSFVVMDVLVALSVLFCYEQIYYLGQKRLRLHRSRSSSVGASSSSSESNSGPAVSPPHDDTPRRKKTGCCRRCHRKSVTTAAMVCFDFTRMIESVLFWRTMVLFGWSSGIWCSTMVYATCIDLHYDETSFDWRTWLLGWLLPLPFCELAVRCLLKANALVVAVSASESIKVASSASSSSSSPSAPTISLHVDTPDIPDTNPTTLPLERTDTKDILVSEPSVAAYSSHSSPSSPSSPSPMASSVPRRMRERYSARVSPKHEETKVLTAAARTTLHMDPTAANGRMAATTTTGIHSCLQRITYSKPQLIVDTGLLLTLAFLASHVIVIRTVMVNPVVRLAISADSLLWAFCVTWILASFSVQLYLSEMRRYKIAVAIPMGLSHSCYLLIANLGVHGEYSTEWIGYDGRLTEQWTQTWLHGSRRLSDDSAIAIHIALFIIFFCVSLFLNIVASNWMISAILGIATEKQKRIDSLQRTVVATQSSLIRAEEELKLQTMECLPILAAVQDIRFLREHVVVKRYLSILATDATADVAAGIAVGKHKPESNRPLMSPTPIMPVPKTKLGDSVVGMAWAPTTTAALLAPGPATAPVVGIDTTVVVAPPPTASTATDPTRSPGARPKKAGSSVVGGGAARAEELKWTTMWQNPLVRAFLVGCAQRDLQAENVLFVDELEHGQKWIQDGTMTLAEGEMFKTTIIDRYIHVGVNFQVNVSSGVRSAVISERKFKAAQADIENMMQKNAMANTERYLFCRDLYLAGRLYRDRIAHHHRAATLGEKAILLPPSDEPGFSGIGGDRVASVTSNSGGGGNGSSSSSGGDRDGRTIVGSPVSSPVLLPVAPPADQAFTTPVSPYFASPDSRIV